MDLAVLEVVLVVMAAANLSFLFHREANTRGDSSSSMRLSGLLCRMMLHKDEAVGADTLLETLGCKREMNSARETGHSVESATNVAFAWASSPRAGGEQDCDGAIDRAYEGLHLGTERWIARGGMRWTLRRQRETITAHAVHPASEEASSASQYLSVNGQPHACVPVDSFGVRALPVQP